MDKYLSRKFILAVLSAVGGIAVSLSKLDGKIGTIAAIISIIVPSIVYIITEGRIDAAAVTKTTDEILDVIKENENESNV